MDTMRVVTTGTSDPVFQFQPCATLDIERLRGALGCSETLATVLVRRGITDPEQARTMLDTSPPDASEFGDPWQLGDMAAAVERIRFAIDDRQLIVVHGDYDADGICATTLLVEALESLGAAVIAFLPNRMESGYGLALETVDRLAMDGARLLITVDCGITAIEPIKQAHDHGIDVIVCDHHQPAEQLPAAIICSTRPSGYAFQDLCATSVAGKLAVALGADLGDSAYELEAIATVADCVPLVGENRAIVRRGLSALRRTSRPGLRALFSACDTHARDVDEMTIGFKIAPRINASGRIDDPERAYELLRATDETTANLAARRLHEINAQRRTIEDEIKREAVAQVEAWTQQQRDRRLWVVCGEGWHQGVVGIVAARLVELYRRPVIVLGAAGPLALGSGRSIPGFDLHAALASVSDLLVRWGGHEGAVGLTVDPAAIDEVSSRLAAYAAERVTDEMMRPHQQIDAIVAGDELGAGLVEDLAQLAPFGMGNPQPMILIRNAEVREAAAIGDGSHLKLRISADVATAPVIAFGQGHRIPELPEGARIDLSARASMNRFRGRETFQLEASQVRVHRPAEDRRIESDDADPQVMRCQTSCTFSCDQRVSFTDVLHAASAPSVRAVVTSTRQLPPVGQLIESNHVIDARGRPGGAMAHVARVLTTGTSVVVVCADVARRRASCEPGGALDPGRLGALGPILLGEHCNIDQALIRLQRASEHSARIGAPLLALIEESHLEAVLVHAGSPEFDIVVLDPLLDAGSIQLLTTIEHTVHLAYGAAETRFTVAAAAAMSDVRATLGPSWSTLRTGDAQPEAVERAVFGASGSAPLHAPATVAHGLYELTRRGFIEIDAGSASITPR